MINKANFLFLSPFFVLNVLSQILDPLKKLNSLISYLYCNISNIICIILNLDNYIIIGFNIIFISVIYYACGSFAFLGISSFIHYSGNVAKEILKKTGKIIGTAALGATAIASAYPGAKEMTKDIKNLIDDLKNSSNNSDSNSNSGSSNPNSNSNSGSSNPNNKSSFITFLPLIIKKKVGKWNLSKNSWIIYKFKLTFMYTFFPFSMFN
jgi:hypothetical protein